MTRSFTICSKRVNKGSLVKKNKRSCRIIDIMISAVLCYDVSVIFLQSDPIKLRTVSLEYVEEIIFESHYVAVISLRRQLLVDAIPAVLCYNTESTSKSRAKRHQRTAGTTSNTKNYIHSTHRQYTSSR